MSNAGVKKFNTKKVILAVCLSLAAAFLLTVIGYVIYVFADYGRIEDNVTLDIKNGADAEAPYHEGQFVLTVDGFIVSDNVTVKESCVIENDFKLSDHDPARMTFILN